jgi:hypothetical protein
MFTGDVPVNAFVMNDDIRILRDIEQYYSTQIDEMPMNGLFIFIILSFFKIKLFFFLSSLI